VTTALNSEARIKRFTTVHLDYSVFLSTYSQTHSQIIMFMLSNSLQPPF